MQKYNPETMQYENEPLSANDTETQPSQTALAPSVAVTGEIVKKTKYMSWGMIALITILILPQLKRALSKINRW